MKRILLTTAAIAAGLGATAYAETFADRAYSQFKSEGYSKIEIESENGQTSVEAVRDGVKVETVYDDATGDILAHESEPYSDDDEGEAEDDDEAEDHESDEDDNDSDDDSDDDGQDDDDDDDADEDGDDGDDDGDDDTDD